MLGDTIQRALEMVGITQQRVERWLGDCCCEERKEKLNQLDMTARRIIKGRIEGGKTYLERLLKEQT